MNPTISVIVPNYNHAPFLRKRIDSILEQTFSDFELILLDDCSKDESREILNSYASHPKVGGVHLNEQNSGSTFKQWAKGISLAKGEWVWIAESDDFADPNFLSAIAPFLTRENVLVFSNSFRIDQDNTIMSQTDAIKDFPNGADFRQWTGKEFISEYLLYTNCISNASAVVMKKEALQLFDFARLPYKVAGDWYVYSTLLQHGNVAYLKICYNYFRCYHNSVRAAFQYRPSGIEEMLQVVEANASYLKIDKLSWPNEKEYLPVFWFTEALKNTPFYKSAFYDLLAFLPRIRRIEPNIYRILGKRLTLETKILIKKTLGA